MTVQPTAANPNTIVLLERDYYTSDDIFALEYDRIYSREWIYAGHISQLPSKGSFFKLEYGGEEIVVVRGEGDHVYAHLNVCRHRGFRLCAEETGKVRAFVCPYHHWRYDLDGTLRSAPQMPDGEYFDYADYPLRTAQVEVWHGLVFVNLNTEPVEPIASQFSNFDAMVDKFAPERTKLVHEKKYLLDANWKVAVENALECYHCPGSHRALCAVVDVPGLIADLKDWLADDEGDGPSDRGQSGMRIQAGMQTLSLDGTLITTKLLGACTDADVEAGVSGGVMFVPNFAYAAFYVDHWWTVSVRPISAHRTEFVYSWFVREDAVEGEDFDLDRLVEVGHVTQTEDNVLIERTQAGIDSRFYVPGPINLNAEPALHDFVSNYLKFMA
jgi:phenylpropionate dioxygenase-like ring-hydroxylating dioxygenase large terminal subunit